MRQAQKRVLTPFQPLFNLTPFQPSPYSLPPASRKYRYGPEACPTAWKFLQTWIRWSTFCEKYTEAHCELARDIVKQVADKNRKRA